MRSGALAVAVLLAIAAGAVDAQEWPATYHSGRVVAVDRSRGTITIEEVGPRGPAGAVRTTRYTASIGDWTEVGLAIRAGKPTPGDFPDMWTEVPLALDDVAPGDYVTLECERRGRTDVVTHVVITLDDTPR